MKKENIKKSKTRKKVIELRKLIICLILIIAVITIISIFGRYITSAIHDFYLRSKEFYFYSDKLKEEGAEYQVENWSGVDEYTVTINMNSLENNLKGTSYDIDYTVSYTYSDNIICTLSKEAGTIYASTNTDYFNLTLTPTTQLDTGDEVWVEISATSTGQYTKTITGKFTLVVGKENFSYKIEDEAESPYLELSLTNAVSYYQVSEAFDSYSVGDRISADTYLELSDENKAKCYSAIVTLSFDPSEVVVDMTDINFTSATDIQYTTIDGYTFVNQFTVYIDAISSVNIRFYKNDITKDYTYTGLSGETSVITVSYVENE